MDVQEKKAITLELLLAGATTADVAARLGYKSNAAAARIVDLVRKENPDEFEYDLPPGPAPTNGELTEMQRLDAMLDAIWPDCLDGKLQAINTALKIQERRAELASGGAKPQSTTQPGEVQPVDEFTRRLAERLSNAPGQRAV